MNIAVLFTGQIRINHDVNENLKFLFSELSDANIDYFCTTWYESDIDYKSVEKLFNFKIFDVESNNQYTTQFIKDYNEYSEFCINYKNDDVDYLVRSEHDRNNGVWKNVPLIFYKFNRGIKLINKYQELNDIKYDLIIRLRWDAEFLNGLTLDHINEVIFDNKLGVYIHSYELYKNLGDKIWNYSQENLMYHKYVDGWVDETIYYGNPNVMNSFCDIYDKYYETCVNKNCWIVHVILKYYIENFKISTVIPELIVKLKGTIIYHYHTIRS